MTEPTTTIELTAAEIAALCNAAGEVAGGDMELWTDEEREALASAHGKLNEGVARRATGRGDQSWPSTR